MTGMVKSKGKKSWALESVCPVLYNKTIASLPETPQCHSTVSVKDLLLHKSELDI